MPGSVVMKSAGISRSALVNYERHGAVRPARDENGYRVYSRDDLLDVMCCTMLTSMGYSVAEAADILQDDDVMSPEHIDGYRARLAAQRDMVQTKMDNLTTLRRTVTEAQPPEVAPLELAECPDWLFFFDEHESVDIREVKSDNQVTLMRSMPLACRGFMMSGFFDDVGSQTFRWARTLRCDHAHLLDVDLSRA